MVIVGAFVYQPADPFGPNWIVATAVGGELLSVPVTVSVAVRPAPSVTRTWIVFDPLPGVRLNVDPLPHDTYGVNSVGPSLRHSVLAMCESAWLAGVS